MITIECMRALANKKGYGLIKRKSPFPMETIGERIKYVRKEVLCLTQYKLAKKIGVASKATISNYEKGTREPSIKIFIAISKLGNISLDWLISGIGLLEFDNSGCKNNQLTNKVLPRHAVHGSVDEQNSIK